MTTATASGAWPITIGEVRAARQRLAQYLTPTPLRSYQPLDQAVGSGIRVLVKHENHQPTGAFKVRNGLAAVTALSEEQRRRGIIGATRGNHGLGLAYAGRALGVDVTICVPHGNNPEKNAAMEGLGAKLVVEGRDYDESVAAADRLVKQRDLTLVHSTNNRQVIAGAATLTLELLEQADSLEAIVMPVGGGSQAVGALTVCRALRPSVKVYAVQAEGASAIYQSWKAGRPLSLDRADTFADGMATRTAYEATFATLKEGLAGFVTVTDAEIAEAVRTLLSTTHNLAEGAGAAPLAGLLKLREQLAGKRVVIVMSGGNLDLETLGRIVRREL